MTLSSLGAMLRGVLGLPARPAPQETKPFEGPKPRVDDQFWFDISKQIVEGALTRRDEAAAKLQKLIAWLWAIYTASAALGLTLTKAAYPPAVIALIVAPSPVLVLAYVLAVFVEMPRTVQFDARAPRQIEREYHTTLLKKASRLRWSLAATSLAAALVSVAIIAASVSKQTAPYDFTAHLNNIGQQQTISLAAVLPPSTLIVLRFTALNTAGKIRGTPEEFRYTSTEAGDLYMNIPLRAQADAYEVILAWQEPGGPLRTLTRAIAASAPSANEATSSH